MQARGRTPIHASLCRYAAVLYLNPDVPDDCGTSFYRSGCRTARLGGNYGSPARMPTWSRRWEPASCRRARSSRTSASTIASTGCCSTSANLIHSATAYWGHELAEKRMAAVFFWMA